MYITDYEKILQDNTKDVNFATKLLIVDEMQSFDGYKNLKDIQKDKILSYTYMYYIDLDGNDTTTYDIVNCAINSIGKEIETMNFTEFAEKIDKCLLYL